MLWDVLLMHPSAPAPAYRQDLKCIQMKMTKLSLHARMHVQHHPNVPLGVGTVGIFALGHPLVFGGAALLNSCAGQGRIMGLNCSRISCHPHLSSRHLFKEPHHKNWSNDPILEQNVVHRSMHTSSTT